MKQILKVVMFASAMAMSSANAMVASPFYQPTAAPSREDIEKTIEKLQQEVRDMRYDQSLLRGNVNSVRSNANCAAVFAFYGCVFGLIGMVAGSAAYDNVEALKMSAHHYLRMYNCIPRWI